MLGARVHLYAVPTDAVVVEGRRARKRAELLPAQTARGTQLFRQAAVPHSSSAAAPIDCEASGVVKRCPRRRTPTNNRMQVSAKTSPKEEKEKKSGVDQNMQELVRKRRG